MREALANTWDEAQKVLNCLRDSRDVTYDTETSGLSWQRNHIVGYVITPRNEPSWYVPVRHAGGGNLDGCRVPMTNDGWKGDLHPFELELAEIAGSDYRRWVGHNLLFDLRMSARHNIRLYGTYEDTSINAPLINENLFGFSLDACAKREEVQFKKGDELYEYMAALFDMKAERKIMSEFWRTDASVPVVWQYAAGDGVTTEELCNVQQKSLDEDSEYPIRKEDDSVEIVNRSLRKVWGVECRLIKTLFRMTYSGVRVDEERLHRADKLFEKRAEAAGAAFPKDFNSKSPLALREFFKDQIDEDWPRNPPTKTEIAKARTEERQPLGALKFDEKTLQLVPAGRNVITFRQLTNARSLYTQPAIRRHLWQGGIHCDFAQMAQDEYGTISGRLSCYDPNLQAVSKRNKAIGPIYRAAFVPDPGCVWKARDYKQQEYVVFTDYTEDPNLMAGYAADPPVDIHQMVADMLGVERDPTAKRMNLGMLYGMGIVKLAFSLGVSVEQAQKWMDEYHRRIPAARRFLKGAEKKARSRGYVFTYLGRRRHFDANFAHKAGNGIIQGSSADITKLKMVEIDEMFEAEDDHCRLMLQIHDDLHWSAPDDERGRRISAEADRIMGDFYSDDAVIRLKAKLGIDASEGSNWAEATWGPELVEEAWAA